MGKGHILIYLLSVFPICIKPAHLWGNIENGTPATQQNTKALTLIEFYSLTNTIPRELIDLQNEIQETNDTEKLLGQLPPHVHAIQESVITGLGIHD